MLGNGYNDEVFRTEGPATVRDVPVVLAAGKFVHWKGFRFIIRACAALTVPYRLVILGSGPDSEASSPGAQLRPELVPIFTTGSLPSKRRGTVDRIEWQS